MKSLKRQFIVLIFSISWAFASVSVGGSFMYYNRLSLSDSVFWTWNEGRLLLNFEANPTENTRLFSELRFSLYTPLNAENLNDLAGGSLRKSHVFMDIKEAYIDVYGLFSDNLDLRAGKQIIAWGTADRINPTSNLSPYNFEDILDFGEKEGISSVKLTYNSELFTVETDFVPFFRPYVLLPMDLVSVLKEEVENKTPGIRIWNVSDTVIMPENTLSESGEFGIRLGTTVKCIDLSFSYFRGLFGLPLLSNMTLVPIDTLGNMNMLTSEKFARVQVIGADFSTSVFGTGLWGEMGVYIPEEFIRENTYPTMYGMVTTYDTVLSDPFVKYVIGTDYNFKHGFYVNLQFVHGFLHEYGDSLNNYVMGRIEKKVLNDRLKLVPLSGIVTAKNSIKDNYAYAYVPEISYVPYDNVEMILGGLISNSKNIAFFPGTEKQREVYLKIKMEF